MIGDKVLSNRQLLYPESPNECFDDSQAISVINKSYSKKPTRHELVASNMPPVKSGDTTTNCNSKNTPSITSQNYSRNLYDNGSTIDHQFIEKASRHPNMFKSLVNFIICRHI